MKLTLEPLEKFQSEGVPALIILAEQEKLLGSLPKDRSQMLGQVLDVLKRQANKVLNDTFELIPVSKQLLAIAQMPQKKGLNREDRLRMAATRMADLQRSRSLPRIAVSLDKADAREVRALCEGFLISTYEFRKYKSDKKPDKNGGAEVVLLVSANAMKNMSIVLQEAEIVCRQINLCRDLVNEPGSALDPQKPEF